jgi:hypothetical protein
LTLFQLTTEAEMKDKQALGSDVGRYQRPPGLSMIGTHYCESCVKGMRASLAAVFLYSRAVNLPLIPLMIHYFGTTYTLALCLYLLRFSITGWD